jgi:hypothetical protein
MIAIPMCGSSFRSGRVFSAVLLSVLVVVTCSAEAQQIPPANRSASQLPDAPSAVARVSDIQKNLNIFGISSGLHLIPDARQGAWWMSSFGNQIQNRLALNQPAMQYADTRMVVRWLMFAPNYGRVQPKTIHSADDWQYYGHHIPVAGPVVLRVGQEAQAHPHVVSLFKVIQPQF